MTTLIQFNYSYFNYIITVINAKLTILEVEKLKETFQIPDPKQKPPPL